MGIAAIVLGAIGLLIAVLPFMATGLIFISWLCWLFAILGLIFGIIALAKGKTKPGLVGTILSVLTIAMYFVAAHVVANRAVKALSEAVDKDLPALQDALDAAK